MLRNRSSEGGPWMPLWRRLVPITPRLMLPVWAFRGRARQALALKDPDRTAPCRTGGGRWKWQESLLVDAAPHLNERMIAFRPRRKFEDEETHDGRNEQGRCWSSKLIRNPKSEIHAAPPL